MDHSIDTSSLRSGIRRSLLPDLQRSWAPLAGVVFALAFLVTTGLLAQQAKPNEYQVKATYLYNFGRFVKWPGTVPAGKGDSFSVCVIGQDPFGSILDSTLAGEALDGRPVVLRRISKPQDAGECRILFISSKEEKHLSEILTALDQSGVLTVSDMPGFTRRGGMIQFVLEGDRVRFEINLASAESARLVLSSELLKVAASVRRNGRSGD
jgi:uncharacterized protein DUF4154